MSSSNRTAAILLSAAVLLPGCSLPFLPVGAPQPRPSADVIEPLLHDYHQAVTAHLADRRRRAVRAFAASLRSAGGSADTVELQTGSFLDHLDRLDDARLTERRRYDAARHELSTLQSTPSTPQLPTRWLSILQRLATQAISIPTPQQPQPPPNQP